MLGSVLLALLVLLPVPDIIRLETGASVEGRIIRENPEQVVILTATGEMVIPRARIRAIERGPWSVDVFEERWAEIDKSDLKALDELLEWCLHPDRAASLRLQARTVARYITAKLDKNHERAWGVLDYVRFEGRWVPRAQALRLERERAEREAEEAKRAREEEQRRIAERGTLELIGGVALAEQVRANREQDLRQEAEIRKELGWDFIVRSSRRISVKGILDPEQAMQFLELGERMCGTLNRELGLPVASSPFKTGKHERLHFFLVEPNQFVETLRYVNGRYTTYPPEFLKFSLERGGRITADGEGCVGIQIRGLGDDRDVFCHFFGHAYVESLGRNVGHWFTEGFAIYCALRFHGSSAALCTTQSRYAETPSGQARKSLVIPMVFRELRERRMLPAVRSLQKKHMNRLDERDLAKSWGTVVYFMTDPRRAKFLDYLRRMPLAGGQHDTVLQAVYGIGFEQLDGEIQNMRLED